MTTPVDDYFHQTLAPLMRPGESAFGLGFVSNVVPMLARLVPILTSYYASHQIILATNQRILVAKVPLDFWGQPKPEIFVVYAIELSDVARAELFDPHIILHQGIRITRKNGHITEWMYPSTKAAVTSQSQFVQNFPSWLVQAVGAGQFQPVPGAPDPRTPDVPLPSLAITYWLGVIGGILTAGFAMMALGMLTFSPTSGFVSLLLVAPASYGLLLLWRKIAERKALLAGQPLPPVMTRSRYAMIASAVFLGLCLLLLPWTTFTWFKANQLVDTAIQTATLRRTALVEAYTQSTETPYGLERDYHDAMEAGRAAILETNLAASDARFFCLATVACGGLFAFIFLRQRTSKGVA